MSITQEQALEALDTKTESAKRGHKEAAVAFVNYEGATSDLNALAAYVTKLENILRQYIQQSAQAAPQANGQVSLDGSPTDHFVDVNKMVRAEPGGAEMLVDKKFAAWVASDPVGRSADSRAMSMIMHGWLGREASDRRDGLPFGLVDPDYARIFTIARCLAWADGYAITMHGSFTRDLDLVAVPWAESAREPERLVRRIAEATGTTESGHPPSIRPHGRKTWTLLLPGFSDPRWVDLSVICPRDYDAALRAAMKQESSNG